MQKIRDPRPWTLNSQTPNSLKFQTPVLKPYIIPQTLNSPNPRSWFPALGRRAGGPSHSNLGQKRAPVGAVSQDDTAGEIADGTLKYCP